MSHTKRHFRILTLSGRSRRPRDFARGMFRGGDLLVGACAEIRSVKRRDYHRPSAAAQFHISVEIKRSNDIGYGDTFDRLSLMMPLGYFPLNSRGARSFFAHPSRQYAAEWRQHILQ